MRAGKLAAMAAAVILSASLLAGCSSNEDKDLSLIHI